MGKLWEETRGGILAPFQGKQTRFGYDAVDDVKKRRRAPKTVTRNEDDELNSTKRKKLIATTRDLLRNYSIAGWAVRKHLDYTATFHFQARTQDAAFNSELEALMETWSLPANCDIAGRHSLKRFVRLAEQGRTVDGDVLLIKLSSGHLQAVEGDRIQTPEQANIQNTAGGAVLNGVKVDANNRALEYCVQKRNPGSSILTFDKWISAIDSILLGYYDRFDQVRGISRLAPAVNAFQDLYECTDYALAKAKVSQLFGLVTYREAGDPYGTIASATSGGYDVNFGTGPFHLDLDDGDKAEVLESKTPSTEYQGFAKQIIGAAIKALDIPFSFFDESFTNYSGARQALLQYEQSVEAKRGDLVEALDNITEWKVAQWIASGLLRLPAGIKTIDDIPWDWVPAGIPWIDPLKEVEADAKAIQLGVKSRQRTCRERGGDFFQTVDELAQEQEYAEAKGVQITPPEKGAPNGGMPPEEGAAGLAEIRRIG